ncbi:MAG: cupin domain-containing protein [Rhodobacterales bacterium]|nr:cupin domain-containing protein [Rhodobacterales bacterium]
MNDALPHLARKIKARRIALGWNLDRLAEEAGVDAALLEPMERGESVPTVAVLWKIAKGLKVSFTALMHAPGKDDDIQPQIRDAARLRRPMDEGVALAVLFPFDPRLGFEMVEVTLRPGFENRTAAHEAGMVETLMAVSGTMEILVDEAWHALAPGQFLRFAGDTPHGYRNPGATPAVFVAINSYT